MLLGKFLFEKLISFIIKCVFAYGSYMIQKEFCQDCQQQHDCREVYRRLGHATCPSIFNKVIVAFLLPLIVFIVSLAVLNKIFAATGQNLLSPSGDGIPANGGQLQTAVSFFAAILITALCVLITRIINKKLHKVL